MDRVGKELTPIVHDQLSSFFSQVIFIPNGDLNFVILRKEGFKTLQGMTANQKDCCLFVEHF